MDRIPDLYHQDWSAKKEFGFLLALGLLPCYNHQQPGVYNVSFGTVAAGTEGSTEEKHPYAPLTPENTTKANLKRLTSDIRYQFEMAAAFGMDGLAKLMKKARQQDDTAHNNCAQ